MKLSELCPSKCSRKNRKRKGRGNASGNGTTAGRGAKGHNCRSGGGVRPGFEGGQMPIHRRLPKRGFVNIFKKEFSIINLSDLERFEENAVVDNQTLYENGLIKNITKNVKLLGSGKLDKALTVKICAASESAKQKIESVGGTLEIIC